MDVWIWASPPPPRTITDGSAAVHHGAVVHRVRGDKFREEIQDDYIYNVFLNRSKKKADPRFLDSLNQNNESATRIGNNAETLGREKSTPNNISQQASKSNGG